MNYTLYFDANHLDGRDWVFVSSALFMCLTGSAMMAFRARLKMGAFFPILFLGISLAFATLVGFGTWLGKQTGLPNHLRLEKCAVVEGEVTNFRAMPEGGGTESFSVGGQHFEYSGKVSSSQSGFSQPVAQGGPIRDGLRVRIHHRDGIIARLELARRTDGM